MPDYKDLYYRSQAQLAEAIEVLEFMKQKLIKFTQDCETMVINSDDDDDDNDETREIITTIYNE